MSHDRTHDPVPAVSDMKKFSSSHYSGICFDGMVESCVASELDDDDDSSV